MHRVERQNCIYSETQNCPYSYSEQTCPLLDIWDDFRAGDEVIAITHHATCDKEELSVVRGEILTFIVQHGDKFCKVKNLEGMIGFLPLSHINLKEDFQDEPWYLEVCTRKMAEAIVNPQTRGSYLVWRSDELSDKLIIAVKSQTCVEHFEFRKKGRQLILGDRVYKSIHHVINEFKRKEILVSAIYVTFPNINPNTHFQIIAENLVVTGMNLRASKNFRLHKKISHVAKLREGHTYILIGTLPDRSWYAVRDVVMGVEGYVPAEYLQPLYPPWFHGERSGNEISAALSMCQRTCSFLVAKICAVQNKQTPYVIGVLDPQRKIQIFEIEYKSERVSCFNSVGESIVQLINRFLSENTVPMLRFAVTNTGNYPLPTEMTDLDMKTMDLYFTALEEGSEKSYDIRLMIVGHFGVGKTTVARKLLQEPTENIYSAKGIETQVKRARIDIQTGDWMCENGLPEQDEILNERLAHVVRVNSKDENGNSERTYKLTDGYSTIDKQHAIYTTKSADCYDSITELHNKKQVEDNGYDTVNSFLRCKNWEDESRKNRRRISSESDTCLNAKKEKKKLLRNSLKDLTPEKRKRISDIVKRSSQEGTLPGFISIWDFAGQYIYYATHQVFLATNAIYFLLFDMSKSLDENITITDCPDRQTKESGRTARSFIELWLQSIHAKKDGEIGELPPVILVGTHKDKIPCSPSEQEEYINNYFESVRCLFDRSPLSNHIQPEQICLDNTVDESGVSELRNIIFEVAKRMPWWGKLKPAKWINLEQILMSMKEVKPLVRIQEIIEKNNKSPLPLANEDEIRAFLRTQHSSGDCLFFEESGLEETVVLRPQWIIDAFKSVVLSYEQLRRYCYLRPYLSDLSEKGILHKACIDQLWSENDYKTFAEHKETIIRYMIKLCIIAKGNRSNSGEMFYFVPSLLPECKYGRDIDLQMAISENELSQDVRTDTPSLYIKVETSCFYPSLFHNIMSDCLSRWQTVRLNERYILYSTGGLFSLDKSKCHLMSLKLDFLEKSAFYIICKIANVAKESVDTRKCDEVRRFLVSSVATHINLHDPGLLELLIQCTHPNKTNILGSLSSCELLDTYDSVGCHGHSSLFYNNVISSQQLLSFWFPNGYRKNDFSSLKQWVVEAPEYVNDKTLLDRDFEKLAMALGIGWEHVGISLGISSVEMDQCKLDYPQRTDMQVYAVLKKWEKKNKRKVTFLMFVKALFENEMVNVDWDAVKNVGEDIYS